MSLKNLKLSFVFLLGFGTAGCSHALHEYHVSDMVPIHFSAKNAERISAEGQQKVIMGFVQDTQYVDATFTRLQNQCTNGVVTGINTRYSTSHGFFHWTNKIKMSAYCLKNS